MALERITFVLSVWIVGVKTGVLLWVFWSLWVNEPKTYSFSAERIRQLHQNCILRLAGKSSKKKLFFFWKNHIVLFCFGFSTRNSLIMDEKIIVALLDLLSTCLANISGILDNLNIFSQLSGFEQKEVGVPVQKFPQDCRNYIIRVQRIILRRGSLYERITFPKVFLDQECKLFALLKLFFSAGFLNMNAICPEVDLAKKTFGKKSIRFCHNVWTISKNDLACWREKLVILALLTINFRVSWKSFAGSSELNSTRSRFCSERNNIFSAVKISWWIMHIRRKVPQGR